MKYIDPHNYPDLAVRYYDVVGGSVVPDLSNGTIFRVVSDSSFDFSRLRNQIDGSKFFLEVYNSGVAPITVSFDPDYLLTDLSEATSFDIPALNVGYYEMICRLGFMLVYAVEEFSPTNVLTNPKDDVILTNPKTGESLIAAAQ